MMYLRSRHLGPRNQSDSGLTVAMVGTDPQDTRQMERSMASHPGARLLHFHTPQDFTGNLLACPADLVVMGAALSNEANRRMLRWMRRQWPPCPAVVVSAQAGPTELTARQHGALFFLSPLSATDCQGALEGALRSRRARTASA